MEVEPDPKVGFNPAIRTHLALLLWNDCHWSDPDPRWPANVRRREKLASACDERWGDGFGSWTKIRLWHKIRFGSMVQLPQIGAIGSGSEGRIRLWKWNLIRRLDSTLHSEHTRPCCCGTIFIGQIRIRDGLPMSEEEKNWPSRAMSGGGTDLDLGRRSDSGISTDWIPWCNCLRSGPLGSDLGRGSDVGSRT